MLDSSSENLRKTNDDIPLLCSGWQLYRSGTKVVFHNFFVSLNRVTPKGLFRSGVTSSCFPHGFFSSPPYNSELTPTGLYSRGCAINLITSTTPGLQACLTQHMWMVSDRFWRSGLTRSQEKLPWGVRSASCLRLIIEASLQAWLNLVLPTSKATQKLEITWFIHSPTVLCWTWRSAWLSHAQSPSSPFACGFQQKAIFQPFAQVYQLFEILHM